MKFLKKPVPLWSHFAVFGVVALVLGALVAGVAAGVLTPAWLVSALGSHSVLKNEQVVTSMEKKEQTVLLQLGVKGVSEAEGIPPAILKDFPLLQKARYMIYGGKVKLGVDHVIVKATGDHEFTVEVPEFIWIGDDVDVEQIISSDGILSAFTAQKSEAEQFNNLISNEDKADYVEQNLSALRDQAEFVFTKYATSIDPNATLTFVFANGVSE
ncbi:MULTISPECIES: hypothetical protein [unclassified Microbacterium]|uniref:hypothetical protein n=1 Tax=unclassified Microbacterium TaxID=2609290 RepID=UPI00301A2367